MNSKFEGLRGPRGFLLILGILIMAVVAAAVLVPVFTDVRSIGIHLMTEQDREGPIVDYDPFLRQGSLIKEALPRELPDQLRPGVSLVCAAALMGPYIKRWRDGETVNWSFIRDDYQIFLSSRDGETIASVTLLLTSFPIRDTVDLPKVSALQGYLGGITFGDVLEMNLENPNSESHNAYHEPPCGKPIKFSSSRFYGLYVTCDYAPSIHAVTSYGIYSGKGMNFPFVLSFPVDEANLEQVSEQKINFISISYVGAYQPIPVDWDAAFELEHQVDFLDETPEIWETRDDI